MCREEAARVLCSWGCICRGRSSRGGVAAVRCRETIRYGFALVSVLGKALCVTVFMRVCEHRVLETACFGVCGKLSVGRGEHMAVFVLVCEPGVRCACRQASWAGGWRWNYPCYSPLSRATPLHCVPTEGLSALVKGHPWWSSADSVLL